MVKKNPHIKTITCAFIDSKEKTTIKERIF